jgi:hypothetical protein
LKSVLSQAELTKDSFLAMKEASFRSGASTAGAVNISATGKDSKKLGVSTS